MYKLTRYKYTKSLNAMVLCVQTFRKKYETAL